MKAALVAEGVPSGRAPGWTAKELVVRFAGGRSYQALIPLFVGCIIGEMAAVIITLAVGWIHFLSIDLTSKASCISLV